MELHWINRQDSPARSIALGTFDGVHRGHQELLRETIARQPQGGTSAVLTFSIPPEQYFRGQLQLLSTFSRRVELFRFFGIDEVAWLTFGSELASMEAHYFVENILIGEMKAAEIICGHDFRFGKGRAGDAEFLRKQGERHGFSVKVIPPVQGEGGHTISSTAIRRLLQEGDLAQVMEYLGYCPTYQAVAEGVSGGSEIRFSFDPALVLPRDGIYLITCSISPNQRSAAIAWPGDAQQMLGVFLDDNPKLAGVQQVLEVRLLSKLRGGKYQGATESDVLKARGLLAGICLQDA